VESTRERPGRPLAEVLLPARPEAVKIDLARTALVVVDMQNAFMSPGGCSIWPAGR
jgi:ureidoacrylate peracid hydrolase